jgi:hypothetical protein
MLKSCLLADHRTHVDADAFAARWAQLRSQFQERLAAVVANSDDPAELSHSAAQEGFRQAVMAAWPHVAATVRPADPLDFGTVRSGFPRGCGRG